VRSSKVVMKRPDGNEVDLESYKKNKTSQPASPAKPSVQLSSPRRPPSVSVRIEAPDDRAKRLAEEKEKEEKEKKAQLEKEEAAKKLEQEAQEKEEAEKKAKEEKERLEKEEQQKLEDDRKRKEAEEAAKAEAEKVEKEKAAEEERLRQKLEEEVKERKAQADKEAAEAAAAAKAVEVIPEATSTPAAKVVEKEEGEISASEDDKGAKNSKAFPTSVPSELPRRRPGPLDLSSTQRPVAPSLPSAISTARIIEDLGSVSYPDGIKSPQSDLNVNAKDSKFRYVFLYRDIVIKQLSTSHNLDMIAIS
jgi:translation initiation factor 4G